MKRSYAISDWFYRLSHIIRRNRFALLLYVLICVLFIVVGVAVGANISDKAEFALRNGAGIFVFLRGERGIFAFFFIDVLTTGVYCIFAASMFFVRVASFLSVAPCAYKSYVLGCNVTVIIGVYSVSAIPMLFVAFIPVCIVEIGVLCIISCKCFAFVSLNGRCSPSAIDIKEYYKALLPYLLIVVILILIKAVTLLLFGSALIGVL